MPRMLRNTSGVNQPASAPARSGTIMSRRSSRAMKIKTPLTCCSEGFCRGVLQARAAERRHGDDDDFLARGRIEVDDALIDLVDRLLGEHARAVLYVRASIGGRD